MIRDEALALADKIARLWPRGSITLDTWTEVLEELFYGPAEAALRKLRDTSDNMPTIAGFRTAYGSEIGTATVHVDCSKCGGDGWQTVRNYEVNGRIYNGVKPCTCRNAENTRDVHKRIYDLNNAELRSHGRTPTDAVGKPAHVTGRTRGDTHV